MTRLLFSALREYGIRAGAHVRNSTLVVATGCYLVRSRRQHRTLQSELYTDNMEPAEIQARATIAAALIVSRAVERVVDSDERRLVTGYCRSSPARPDRLRLSDDYDQQESLIAACEVVD